MRGRGGCRSELLVIARNSSFQYKGKAVDIRQVGRELGARYVLEGSVRRSVDRVRIAAQLIDATTGAHRWAERYDRELRNVFAVQDAVARAIVAILAAHVNRADWYLQSAMWGRYSGSTETKIDEDLKALEPARSL